MKTPTNSYMMEFYNALQLFQGKTNSLGFFLGLRYISDMTQEYDIPYTSENNKTVMIFQRCSVFNQMP